MKKVELLSPAGGYETMVGAFNAGADAVYLGGSKFGARAYADNFDRDQVLDALSYAHLHGKRIYMTINTLVKESEFGELYGFILPYAQSNLDGVIVQDFGVMRLIAKEFPEVELHASTQQTVTGVHGARLLKDLGCCRVVPARELSLDEMKAIRNEAGVEVEAFIHGAMCYCYSGMCLFSSMVGERSGNRGRCAQPCRLPYSVEGKGGSELYPLSLKDMSTIAIIPQLIEAGIDSFKIEGRMKKPEYSAGVTALYRKYIDRYYENPGERAEVSKEDMEILKSLYQRTGISEGYYHRHSDRSMVTLSSPAYNPTSEAILGNVHERFLTSQLKTECDIECELTVGEKARLFMTVKRDGETIRVSKEGNEVQAASKRPMSQADIGRQLGKLGGTGFEARYIDIKIDDKGSGTGIFIAVSELNDLRRKLADEMVERLEEEYRSKRSSGSTLSEEVKAERASFDSYEIYETESNRQKELHVLVSTREQLGVLKKFAEKDSTVKRVYIDSMLFLSLDKEELFIPNAELFVALPYITRNESPEGFGDIKDIAGLLEEKGFGGLLVRNLEQLGILREMNFASRIILDYSVYVWNSEAVKEYLDLNRPGDDFIISEMTAPYELSFAETNALLDKTKDTVSIPFSVNIYGHVPMMVSAGCIKKTTDKCSGKLHELHTGKLSITDRMNNEIPVTFYCRNCYNVIWNPHPTSLHKKLDRILSSKNTDNLRIDLTVEDEKRAGEIIEYYCERIKGKDTPDIFAGNTFTTGHFKRGAL